MQTPYGALPYQTVTSKNDKPFRTQLCILLLAAQETNTVNTYMTKSVSTQSASISSSMIII